MGTVLPFTGLASDGWVSTTLTAGVQPGSATITATSGGTLATTLVILEPLARPTYKLWLPVVIAGWAP